MRVPLLDVGGQHQTLAGPIRAQVDDVLRTKRFILGPKARTELFRDLSYKRGDFPATERATAETLALPIYPELLSKDQHRVVAKIAEFYVR